MNDPYNRNGYALHKFSNVNSNSEWDLKPIKERVLYVIRFWSRYGATDDEIEQWLNARHQTVSARRRELVLHGFVKNSGKQRKTSSGRKAIVWTAT